jgi:hypothetical protein
MFGSAKEVIVVSSTSLNVASITAMAISHGLKLGRHSAMPVSVHSVIIAP